MWVIDCEEHPRQRYRMGHSLDAQALYPASRVSALWLSTKDLDEETHSFDIGLSGMRALRILHSGLSSNTNQSNFALNQLTEYLKCYIEDRRDATQKKRVSFRYSSS
jgi:hypothetical protein